MCKNILDNPEWYRPIPRSLIDSFTEDLYGLVDDAYYYGILDKHTWEYVRISQPREATFYALPKVHKKSRKPPGRPIVSGRGCLTDNLSKFVDNQLRPLVEDFPSHIKDTIHFLQMLDGLHIDGQTILVAIDLEAYLPLDMYLCDKVILNMLKCNLCWQL